MIDKENTTRLMDELVASTKLDDYMGRFDFGECLYLSFADYVEDILKEKNIRKSALIRKINMTRSYAYEVLNGYKRPSRDKTLLISFALELDYKGTQRLLISAKHNPLHPKDKRDSIVIFAKFNHHDLIDTNLLLDEFGQDILD